MTSFDFSSAGTTSVVLKRTFAGTGLTSITIPSTVTRVEEEAFAGCSSLSSVVFEGDIAYIGPRAFANCPISTITFGGNIGVVDEEAFAPVTQSRSLIARSVYVPSVSVWCNAIWRAKNANPLYGVEGTLYTNGTEFVGVLSGTIPSLRDFAFAGYRGASISIDDTNAPSITFVGQSVFEDCPNLSSVDFSYDSGTKFALQSRALDNSVNAFKSSALTSVVGVLPSGSTLIPEGCFDSCALAGTLTLPSVSVIKSNAFANNETIDVVDIHELPAGAVFDNNAFEGCSGVTSVIVADQWQLLSLVYKNKKASPGGSNLDGFVYIDSEGNTITKIIIPVDTSFNIFKSFIFYNNTSLCSSEGLVVFSKGINVVEESCFDLTPALGQSSLVNERHYVGTPEDFESLWAASGDNNDDLFNNPESVLYIPWGLSYNFVQTEGITDYFDVSLGSCTEENIAIPSMPPVTFSG